ncbi:MAG: hypothetical protein ACR2NW_00620 [Thermodesulfobacteriota bacterium]
MNRKIFLIFLMGLLSVGLLISSCSGSGDSNTGNQSTNENNINADTDCVYVGAFESVLSFLELNDLTSSSPEELTANETEVGVLESTFDIEAIVYDFIDNGSFPDPGRLFAADKDVLLEVNTSNADTKLIDVFGTIELPGSAVENIDNVDGLAYDPNNNIFYGSNRDLGLDYIFSFTLTDVGNETMIENVEFLSFMPGDILCGSGFCNDIDDLAFDLNGDRLLAIINSNDVINVLVEVDTTDGTMKVIGTIFIDDCSTPLEDIEGLGVTLNGRIFASTGISGNSRNDFFELEIDNSTSPVKVCATRILELLNVDAESLDCSIDSSLQ